MQTKSVSTDSFIALEREMQNRFAELATMFDFNEAERKAIDSLNNVYKLADKARSLLEEDFNFAPKHAVVSAEEFNQQRQQFADLHAKYLTLEANVLMFLKNAGFHDGETSIAHNSKTTAIPTASLNNLAETLEYCRGTWNPDADQNNETTDEE